MLREQLDDLSIFALRELARRTGVNSPTSKKKEQLIKEIVEISEGKKAPQLTKTKQGRPPKIYSYTFADVFMPSNKNKPFNGVSLNQEMPAFERNLTGVSVSGYLDVSTNCSAFLWTKLEGEEACFYVPSAIVENFNLKTGDFLIANIAVADGQNIVNEVLTINNCPANKFVKARQDYLQIEYAEPSLDFGLNNGESLNIKLGECAFVYGNNNNENTKAMVAVLNACKHYKKIYLNVSLAEKNRHLLAGLTGVEMFIQKITCEQDAVLRTVRLATERAKRLFEDGENVVMVVDDVQSVLGSCGANESQAKELVALTKNAKKGSITMLQIMPNGGLKMFEKLADKRFMVEDCKLILM